MVRLSLLQDQIENPNSKDISNVKFFVKHIYFILFIVIILLKFYGGYFASKINI